MQPRTMVYALRVTVVVVAEEEEMTRTPRVDAGRLHCPSGKVFCRGLAWPRLNSPPQPRLAQLRANLEAALSEAPMAARPSRPLLGRFGGVIAAARG